MHTQHTQRHAVGLPRGERAPQLSLAASFQPGEQAARAGRGSPCSRTQPIATLAAASLPPSRLHGHHPGSERLRLPTSSAHVLGDLDEGSSVPLSAVTVSALNIPGPHQMGGGDPQDFPLLQHRAALHTCALRLSVHKCDRVLYSRGKGWTPTPRSLCQRDPEASFRKFP